MNETLIFLLVPETRWSYYYTLLPARVSDAGDFYDYLGLFTGQLPDDPDMRKAIELCRKLEVHSLYEQFGGKKFRTERVFVSKADEALLKQIRDYTDTVLAEVLQVIRKKSLPLYLKKSHFDNPHKSDRINFRTEPLKALSGFYRTEEHIRYRLVLSKGEEQIIPSVAEVQIVTFQPAMILIDQDLYCLADGVSGLRLKPFLDKKDIIIPRQNEKEYFRKFILKNIGNDNIETEGFEVFEREARKRPVLSLQKDITGRLLLELRFFYNNRSIPFSSHKKMIVELEEDEDNYRFYKTKRDRNWEKKCRQFLLENGLVENQPDYYTVEEGNGPDITAWIRTNRELLKKNGFEVVQDKLHVTYYTGNWYLDYKQKAADDWFQLDARIVLEDGRVIPFQDLWKNILSGDREYLFDDNAVFVIPEEWFSRYAAIMLFGEKKKDRFLLHRNQFSLLDEDQPYKELTEIPEDVELPAKLQATLREYQLTGYRWLYHLYRCRMGACLADDMGLGKTIQTIALLLKYKEEAKAENHFSTCLIVAPASVVHNWRNELHKFTPSLLVSEYTGPNRMALRVGLMRWEVVLTTYQTLRNDIDYLQQRRFGIVVLDESQSFKNRDSQVYQAVSMIQGKHFIALSGTPIENSLSDLWSLMSVINPGLLGNHATFYNYFIRPITQDVNGLHAASLRRLIHPFILRRTKEEVLKDLPERTDELIICDADPEQKKMYDEELSRARNQLLERKLLQEQNRRETFGSLQAIIRLRQIANHPRLADPDYTYSSGKFREIFRMLEELINTRHKVLLFSDYVTYLDLVGEEMQRRGWEYAMLTGSTRKREEVIQHFSNSPECRFFLISLKAGGIGLNLTEADYVFILDPWWNLAAEEQAISRSHRMGQKQAVFVYRFVTAGTLEEKILNIQQQKQDISDAIITLKDNSFHPSETELERLLTE